MAYDKPSRTNHVDPQLKIHQNAAVRYPGLNNRETWMLATVTGVPQKFSSKYQLGFWNRLIGSGHSVSVSAKSNLMLEAKSEVTKNDVSSDCFDIHGSKICLETTENIRPSLTHTPQETEHTIFVTHDQKAAYHLHYSFFEKLREEDGSVSALVSDVHENFHRLGKHFGLGNARLFAFANIDPKHDLVNTIQGFFTEHGMTINLAELLSLSWSNNIQENRNTVIFLICTGDDVNANTICAVTVCMTVDIGVLVTAFCIRNDMRNEGIGMYIVMQLPVLLRDYIGCGECVIRIVGRSANNFACTVGRYFARRACVELDMERVDDLVVKNLFRSVNKQMSSAAFGGYNYVTDPVRPSTDPSDGTVPCASVPGISGSALAVMMSDDEGGVASVKRQKANDGGGAGKKKGGIKKSAPSKGGCVVRKKGGGERPPVSRARG